MKQANFDAGFIAHVLTALPSSTLENSKFYIEGDRASFIEVAQILGKPTAFWDKLPDELNGVQKFFISLAETGVTSVGWNAKLGKEVLGQAGSSNALWKGHQWKKLKDNNPFGFDVVVRCIS